MKSKLCFIALILFTACQSNRQHENSIIEYMIASNGDSVLYKQFQCDVTDTTRTRLFIKQIQKQINDTCWEVDYYWYRVDSVPLNRSVERYYSSNKVELVKACKYQLDSLNKYSEVVGDIDYNFNDDTLFASVKFRLQDDITTTESVFLNYTFQKADSLKDVGFPLLVATSTGETAIQYADHKLDTVIFIDHKVIYEKGKGMVQFSLQRGDSNLLYKLVEKHAEQ